ncbi:MAG: hypothetical protein WCO50_07745 [Synechococcus sp. ELA619]
MATPRPWPQHQPPRGARRGPDLIRLVGQALAWGLLATASAALLPQLAGARPPGPGEGGAVLQQFKSLELQKLDEALDLLRSSQRCVSLARSLQGLHECHRREREADWQQRERFHARIEALRLQYGLDRHGEPPTPGRGGEGRPPFGGSRQSPGGFGDPGFR